MSQQLSAARPVQSDSLDLSSFHQTNQRCPHLDGARIVHGDHCLSSPIHADTAGQIGNVSRNSVRGPGFFQADLSVAKNIPITERVATQFRDDAFNVFDTVNLGNPSPSVDSLSGGG
jgi:hypothetical protein